MKIAVLGAGNGGQAYAGYLALLGHEVRLYDRDSIKISRLRALGVIKLTGEITGIGNIKTFTSNLAEAIGGAKLILIVTVANAQAEIAEQISPLIEFGQIILLNPGRTCGAIEFKKTLDRNSCKIPYYLGESQTLMFACRIISDGVVNIIGVKEKVLLSCLPASDTGRIINQIAQVFPSFVQAPNVLYTGLENIGAILHPCVLLFNAATIERHHDFWFYRDMTEQIASFIEKVDKERIAVGHAFGIDILSVKDWIKYAYPNTTGDTLCERMRNNPAYYEIKSPSSIFTRQLLEDIPTGIVPISELGRAAGVACPLMESMTTICESLLGMDFHSHGRTLRRLGFEGMSVAEIMNFAAKGC